MASSWRQELRKETGKNSTHEERRAARDAYISKEAVDTRMGEGTYDALREQEIQKQFGTQGYDSGSEREKRRFDRKFDRRLRNDRLALSPKSPAAPVTPAAQNQNSVIYPWNWDTYQIRPRGGMFSQSFMRTSYFPEAGAENNPELKPRTDWNAIAAEKLGEGKTMQDVIALQKQMGITADGKWGNQTQAAYDAYQQRIQNERLMGPTPDFVSPGTYFDVNGPSPLMKHSTYGNLGYTPTTPTTPTSSETPVSTPVSSTGRKYDINSSEYFRAPHAFVNKDRGSQMITVNGKQYPIAVTKNMLHEDNYAGLENDQTYAYDETTGKFIKVKENMFGSVKGGFDNAEFEGDWVDPNSYYQKRQDWFKANPEPSMRGPLGGSITPEWEEWIKKYNEARPSFYQKQGGKMKINYFQQGGQMQQDQEELKLALTGYVVATKKQPKSEEEVQQLIQEIAMLKQKDPKTYTQLVQLGSQAQQQQQATMAKWGSKLGYIKSLKYAKGGKTCKKHEKGNSFKKKLNFVKQEK